MAVANWSSSAMVKAVLLPLILVLLAMAAGVSSTEDGPVAETGGRFSETPLGRKLLPISPPTSSGKPCGKSCPILAFANKPMCCTDFFGKSLCWDVGSHWVDKCGSCTTRCKAGEVCCKGVCANLLTDKNNCGDCGRKCLGKLKCVFAFCGY